MKNKIIIITALTFLTALTASSQQVFYLTKSHVIGAVREDSANPMPDVYAVTGYPASTQVTAIWDQLKQAVSTNTNSTLINSIQIRSASIQSIYSTKANGTNLIFYDDAFFNQFQGIPGIDVDYLILFSLAHELGHFIHGDVQYIIKTKQSESIADLYACNLLCQMNKATKAKISNVIVDLDGATFSNYYFSKGERIRNLNSFFDKGLCVNNVLADNFTTNANPHGFFVGNYGDYYSASIDPGNNTYTLNLDLAKSGWNWTYAGFADSYVKAFGSSDNVQFSFDITGTASQQLVGYISQPSCVTQSCPGGSHYDLWFIKSKNQYGGYTLESRFFFNDNCQCNIGNHNNDVSKQLATGVATHITIIKHGQTHTVLIDGNQSITFIYNGNILSTLLWGAGAQYLSNFQLNGI